MYHRHLNMAAALCALASYCCAADASALRFDFTATVTATDHTLAGTEVGTTFNGAFSYDPDHPTSSSAGDGGAGYTFAHDSIWADIGGTRVSATRLLVGVFDNVDGYPDEGAMLTASSHLTVGGIDHGLGGFGFSLSRIPGQDEGGVIHGLAAPSSYDVAAFIGDSESINEGWIRTLGEPGNDLLRFQLTSVTTVAVPEPTTWSMYGLGLLAWMTRQARRRRRA
jgi:hypothetical protein